MRSIAVINQKGGVGKTTTAVNVAGALVLDGYRVLLVDGDPQSHASLHLGIEASGEDVTLYDVLVRGAPMRDALRAVVLGDRGAERGPVGEGPAGAGDTLAVVPSHIDLVSAELELADVSGRETRLRDALAPLRERFDVCIIDCPPALGLVTVNALAAADEVLIPLQPHFLALQGLGRLLETVRLIREGLQPGLRVSGVVLCMHEAATKLAQEVAQDVQKFLSEARPEDAWHGARVFFTAIRRNVKLAESPSFGKTVFEYAPESHGAADYRALAREIEALAGPQRRGVTEDVAARWLSEAAPERGPGPAAPAAVGADGATTGGA